MKFIEQKGNKVYLSDVVEIVM